MLRIREEGVAKTDMAKDLITVDRNDLTPAQFDDLAEVPPEIEWLANLTNPTTRRAYKNDVEEFVGFTGLRGIAELLGRTIRSGTRRK